MVLVSPSLLSANLTNLKQEIEKLENAGVDSLHIDVMDGHFVPNLTFGPVLIKWVKKNTKLKLDVHLMITNAEDTIDSYIDAGADMLTIHYEACRHPHRLLSYIRSKGLKAGIALNPGTHEMVLEYLLTEIDLVLVMSVNPGFSGQKFIESSVCKIESIKKMFQANKKDCLIAVDGGINQNTALTCIKAGASMLVCGSYLFEHNDYEGKVQSLKKLKA